MSNDPMRHIRRHYEITGHSFGGRSPYPISKSVGDTVLHPDGRVTPTPAPDAGHAAETIGLSDMTDTDLVQHMLNLADAAGVWRGIGLDAFERGDQVAAFDHYMKGKRTIENIEPFRAELLRRLNHTAPARTGEGGAK